MTDKYFPDAKEPHVHDYGNGMDFTDDKHRHTKIMDGNGLREAACIKVIDDLKATGPTERGQKIIDHIKALVRKYKKGKP